jgi:hypothetical protein
MPVALAAPKVARALEDHSRFVSLLETQDRLVVGGEVGAVHQLVLERGPEGLHGGRAG